MFDKLIKEAYKLSKSGNLIGILYNSGKAIGFNDLNDEDVDNISDNKYDMLYLKSTLTDTEIQIYENELKNYKIKHSEQTLYILTNKGEIGLMY